MVALWRITFGPRITVQRREPSMEQKRLPMHPYPLQAATHMATPSSSGGHGGHKLDEGLKENSGGVAHGDIVFLRMELSYDFTSRSTEACLGEYTHYEDCAASLPHSSVTVAMKADASSTGALTRPPSPFRATDVWKIVFAHVARVRASYRSLNFVGLSTSAVMYQFHVVFPSSKQ